METENGNQRLIYGLLAFVIFFGFIYLSRRVIAPFMVAFAFAYLVDPLVDRLEKWKMSRTVAALLLMAGFFLLIVGSVFLVGPLFRIQAENLTQNLPNYIQEVQEWVRPFLEKIAGLDQAKIQEFLNTGLAKFGEVPLKVLTFITQFLWDSISNLFSILLVIANLVIIPVAMFYLLRDYDFIIKKITDIIPERRREEVINIVKEIDRVLSSFVRGQLTVAMFMAVFYCIGLFLCGTPLSLFIGVIAGFANLIPYLGVVLGFVPAALLTFLQTQEWLPVLGVAAVFGVVQTVEGMLITPRIVGENIGLHPVVVIFAVLLGGELFGFVGIIIGVPAAAVINVLLSRGLIKYKKSSFFSSG